MNTTYVVWRRHPDGYVAATIFALPKGWVYRDLDGNRIQVTFETLLVTTDWNAARIRINAERVADEMLAK